MNNLKTALCKALQKVPDDRLSENERALRDRLADLPEITILQMIYQQKAYEGNAKDHEFSATSMREHWQSGLEDTRRTLKRRDWLALPEQGMGIVVHDVLEAPSMGLVMGGSGWSRGSGYERSAV